MIESLVASFQLPDIRSRILVTIGIMVVFVAATNIPIPGVPYEATIGPSTDVEAILEILDITAGNALVPFSFVAVGIPSVIFSLFLMQWGLVAVYGLKSVLNGDFKKEGVDTRRILFRTVIPASLILGHLLIWILYGPNVLLLEKHETVSGKLIVGLARAAALVAGAIFTLFLIKKNSDKGLGDNGLDILIFAGIVSALPIELSNLLHQNKVIGILGVIAISVITVVFLIFLKEGQRRIAVQYGRRVRGRKIYQGQNTFIPLKILPSNTELVKVPLLTLLYILLPVYAISEVSSGSLQEITESIYSFLRPDRLPYYLLVAAIIPIYLIFDSEVAIRELRLPETLQRQGGFIPGVRPGIRTDQYILSVARRLFIPASIALSLIFLVNTLLAYFIDSSMLDVLIWSSIAVLIIDTMRQLEAQLLMRHYEGFIKSDPTGSMDGTMQQNNPEQE